MRSTLFAIGSALLASLCCTGPILLLMLGTTSAISFAWIEPLRPFLIPIVLILLTTAFWQTSKRKMAQDCCNVEHRRKRLVTRKWLWVIAPLSLALLFLPQLLVSSQSDSSPIEQGQTRIEYQVVGMTCEGCASGLEASLRIVDGIESCAVSYETGRMTCDIQPNKPETAIIESFVVKMGYEINPLGLKLDKGDT